eukprot:m.140536 g.140536  ORF g.140536 m.140536 type:complete len:254 (-) comp11530_c0_seq1:2698-3459(-)
MMMTGAVAIVGMVAMSSTPGRKCGADWFTENLTDVQCIGLQTYHEITNEMGFEGCAAKCCADGPSRCQTFQWKHIPAVPPKDGYAGGGCFYTSKIRTRGTCYGPNGGGRCPETHKCYPGGYRGGSYQNFMCPAGAESVCTLANSTSTNNFTGPTCNGQCKPAPSPAWMTAAHAGAPDATGAILIGVSFALFASYCVVGAALQHRKGERGRAMVPHVDFWTEIPGLIAQGCKYSFGMAKNKVRQVSGHEHYENL